MVWPLSGFFFFFFAVVLYVLFVSFTASNYSFFKSFLQAKNESNFFCWKCTLIFFFFNENELYLWKCININNSVLFIISKFATFNIETIWCKGVGELCFYPTLHFLAISFLKSWIYCMQAKQNIYCSVIQWYVNPKDPFWLTVLNLHTVLRTFWFTTKTSSLTILFAPFQRRFDIEVDFIIRACEHVW